MGMDAGGSRGGVKANINVTPLVDVVLVLLIIFMVVTPMLQRGKDVSLPTAKKQKKETKSATDPLILSVTKEKNVYVEQDLYSEDAKLEERLSNEFVNTPGKRLLLKADQSLTFADVRHVMSVAKKAGAKGIALGVDEKAQGGE
jgi:biopolymer transport protein TolR